MSLYLHPGLHVRIEPFEGANPPMPDPLRSGFDKERTYEVLGMHVPSETAEAYVILRNDRDEIWFISNRHLRVVDVESRVREPVSRLDGAIDLF